MKSIKLGISLILAFGIVSATNPAFAGEVKNRIKHQEARINNGIQSGKLTLPQAARLQERDASINQKRLADLKSNDGHLTAAEYKNLNNRLNNVSNSIYVEKHT